VPFGLIFGALFFAGFSGWLGLSLLVQPALPTRLFGLFLATFGISLALGLISRRRWARWAGVAFCAALVAQGLNLVATRGTVADHVLLLASLVAGILLVVPLTGGAIGPPSRVETRPPRVRSLGTVVLLSLAGLLAASWWGAPWSPGGETTDPSALPVSAVAKRVEWTDFGTGMERARVERMPILATFVTDWCPYCTKMARSTWKASSVRERLGEVVAVRVNAEESGERNGYSGAGLAARYGVSGYPAQVLLDGNGKVIARYDGYQTPSQLLTWLDDALEGHGVANSNLASRGTDR